MQDVLHERDVAVARSGRVDDLEETVSELRRHNKELENQVGNLSMCNTANRHRGQKKPLSGSILSAGRSPLWANRERYQQRCVWNACGTRSVLRLALACSLDVILLAKVTRLCENPFISQAFRDQERSERVLELEQGNRAAQLKIDHLQVSQGRNVAAKAGEGRAAFDVRVWRLEPPSRQPFHCQCLQDSGNKNSARLIRHPRPSSVGYAYP